VTAVTSRRVEQPSRVRRPRLIRQASAWQPGRDPEQLPLQDLENSDAIRWVDIYGGGLGGGEVLGLLNPICHGMLSEQMARDLVTPERYPAGGRYGDQRIGITGAFQIRTDVRSTDGLARSVFEPVELLVGADWLISCWLPPRVFRGPSAAVEDAGSLSNGLYLSVAERWAYDGGESAGDLANLVRGELAIACGYRQPTV
jgi:hypothetical protein